MSKSKSWLRTLIERIEVFLDSSKRNYGGRTRHQHVMPYEMVGRCDAKATNVSPVNIPSKVPPSERPKV